ncbi:MAG TPA: DUF3311 domain-containing protein [Candidatus Dormibacteraeota bacterium]|nr:DUF3311 domain-containing protein [Candidatus Dormibacteraeota bacterium]
MRRRWWYALLLLPFAGTLVPALYDRPDPSLGGIPFFYWYQLLWIVITTLLLGIVVVMTRERRDL